MFGLVNVIASELITHPREVAKLYEGLPTRARDAIERRDDPDASDDGVAEIPGVSVQRVQQLYKLGRLPEPPRRDEVGPLWRKSDIEKWARAEWWAQSRAPWWQRPKTP